MFKEIIISISIITSVVVLNWFLQDYTKNSIVKVKQELEELKQNLTEKDVSKVETKMNQISKKWDSVHSKMAIYIEHDELEKVKTNLVALKGFIEAKEYESGISEINKGIYVLEHIAEKYDFSIVNVF